MIASAAATAAALTPQRLAAASIPIVTKVFDIFDLAFYCSKANKFDHDVFTGNGAGGMDLALLSACTAAAQALVTLPWVCSQFNDVTLRLILSCTCFRLADERLSLVRVRVGALERDAPVPCEYAVREENETNVDEKPNTPFVLR